jgi:hypothetical protein
MRRTARVFAPAKFGFSIQRGTSRALFRSTTRIERCDSVIATDEHTVKQKAAMLKRGGSFASRCCLGGKQSTLMSGELARKITCFSQVALLDLSILNFGLVLG